jgi:transcriptional regulator with XRE-family HTH domain
LKTPTTFGERFKQLREERGLNQPEIAKKLGVIKQTISNYENNNREPEFSDLVKIADFFQISIDYLLGRTDKR